jgi:hypothetical protein
MKYQNGTRSECLTLSTDNLRVVKWYMDASFVVHPDLKSYTGAVMMLGKGAMQFTARKQKMNAWSSTEGKLIAVDNAATMILWTKLFLEAQGYYVEKNILSIKTIKAQFCWKQMVRRVWESKHAH